MTKPKPSADPTQDGSSGDDPVSDSITFGTAMDELRSLVTQLEGDALDVDELADRVARAVQLVEWCRSRLDSARHEVDEVLVGLQPLQTESLNDEK